MAAAESSLLSSKQRYALKTALAMSIAFLVPMWQGWPNATTALTTVMLIAVFGPLGDSLYKGVLRTAGTLLGAIVGMSLVALFPQERWYYLAALSLPVVFLLHLARRYRDDPTFFVLAAVTMMSMFQNGNIDNLFITAATKTAMTVWGIFVYTMVGILILPVRFETTTRQTMHTLTRRLEALLFAPPSRIKPLQKLYEAKDAFHTAVETHTQTAISDDLPRRTWRRIAAYFDEAVALATLLHNTSPRHDRKQRTLRQMLRCLRDKTPALCFKNTSCRIPEAPHDFYDKLCQTLHRIATFLHTPHHGTSLSPKPFRPMIAEDILASLMTLGVYWTAVAFWISANPPGGFFLVVLAVVLGLYTLMTPLSPGVLFVAFTLSFLIATAAYVFILPNLSTGWQLALFIFLYGYIGFAFIPAEATFLFLLPLTLFGIRNTQLYAFDLFLLLLLMFYLFLFLLLFFDYIPISHRPQERIRALRRSIFKEIAAQLSRHRVSIDKLRTLRQSFKPWVAKLDNAYFGLESASWQRYLTRLAHIEALLPFAETLPESLRHDMAEYLTKRCDMPPNAAYPPETRALIDALCAFVQEDAHIAWHKLKESRF